MLWTTLGICRHPPLRQWNLPLTTEERRKRYNSSATNHCDQRKKHWAKLKHVENHGTPTIKAMKGPWSILFSSENTNCSSHGLGSTVPWQQQWWRLEPLPTFPLTTHIKQGVLPIIVSSWYQVKEKKWKMILPKGRRLVLLKCTIEFTDDVLPLLVYDSL